MEYEDKPISFEEYSEEEDENIIEAEEVPQCEGLCPDCYGSGFAMTQRNGVMGVLFTSTTDGDGKSVRRLVPCKCKVELTY